MEIEQALKGMLAEGVTVADLMVALKGAGIDVPSPEAVDLAEEGEPAPEAAPAEEGPPEMGLMMGGAPPEGGGDGPNAQRLAVARKMMGGG